MAATFGGAGEGMVWAACSRLWVRRAVVAAALVLALVLPVAALNTQITRTNLLTEDRVALARYLDGSVARPFAYRVLTPALMRGVRDLGLPAAIERLGAPWISVCAEATAEPRDCAAVLAYLCVGYGFFAAFLATMFVLGLRLAGGVSGGLVAEILAFVVVNAILMLGFSHLYDAAALFFAAAMLAVLAGSSARRDAGFFILLMLASLNKESAILFCVVYAATTPAPWRRVGAQFAAFAAIHLLLVWRFAGNSGSNLEFHLPAQMKFLATRLDIAHLVPLAGAGALMFAAIRSQPLFLRRAAWVFVPWLALFLIGGQVGEVRVAFEVLPVAVLLAAGTVLAMRRGAG